MTFFNISEVRSMGISEARYQTGGARELLRKSAEAQGPFDIFLSHSFQDADLILGVRTILKRAGKRVYVDWIDDPELDRTRVSKLSASRLRDRMNQCSSMIYASTKAASSSKWMPWELGYFDGRKSAESVAIMPLVSYPGENVGQEYLGLYPTVERSSAVASSVIVTRNEYYGRRQKTLDDLIVGRGGSAWRSA